MTWARISVPPAPSLRAKASTPGAVTLTGYTATTTLPLVTTSWEELTMLAEVAETEARSIRAPPNRPSPATTAPGSTTSSPPPLMIARGAAPDVAVSTPPLRSVALFTWRMPPLSNVTPSMTVVPFTPPDPTVSDWPALTTTAKIAVPPLLTTDPEAFAPTDTTSVL